MNLTQIKRAVETVCKETYFKSVSSPLHDIINSFNTLGYKVLDDDNTPLEGYILCGRDGRASFGISFADKILKQGLHIVWHKMEVSGRYEVIGYIL